MSCFDVKGYVASLTDEELCGEVLCWQFSENMTDEELVSSIRKNKISSFFANGYYTPERISFIRSAVKENSKSPCLVATDVECGPLLYPELKNYSISMMNLGASCAPSLAFEIGKYTARLTRSLGIHMPLSPVIDINFNPNNPITNTRSAGDTPDVVVSAAVEYGRGMRSEGHLVMVPKHFPGDGVDDKNQHLTTTVNSLSKEEWMDSYGKVYKQVIADGAESIMVGHIALPWCDPTLDESGFYMPATLSKPLMTGLLKGELGFDGCIISDALSMVGVSARIPIERVSVEFLRAGGDLVLFPEKDDHARILEALHSGYLERERLLDAAERVVKMKVKLGLFDEKEYSASEDDVEKMKELLSKAAKKSITVVKNIDGILPFRAEKGKKVLAISLTAGEKNSSHDEFPTLANELENRGFEVIRMTNPSHYIVEGVIDSVDAVFISSYIDTSPSNCTGSSLRLGWNNIMAFWRGCVFRCKKVIFLSFGDPYKIIGLPFLKTYVNAYNNSEISIKTALNVCFGEEKATGVSPVKLTQY